MLRPLAFISLAIAIAGSLSHAKEIREEVCFTKYGSVSHSHVPTHTKVIHVEGPAVTVVRTVHPRATVTPSAITMTQTAIASRTSTTTLDPSSYTFTSTATEYMVDIETDFITLYPTVTQTNTVTVDTVYTTSTSAPGPAFTPFLDTANVAAPNRRRRIESPELAGVLDARRSKVSSVKQTHLGYPQKVFCELSKVHVPAKAVTKTVSGSTVTRTVLPKIASTTQTFTYTSIKTVIPSAIYVTAPQTDTSKLTATVQATTALTQTVQQEAQATAYVQSATYYPACQQNDNLVGSLNSNGETYYPNGLYNDVGGAADSFLATAASSAESCCSVCHGRADCQGSIYGPGVGGCVIMIDSDLTCSATGQYAGYSNWYDTQAVENLELVISNGACSTFNAIYED